MEGPSFLPLPPFLDGKSSPVKTVRRTDFDKDACRAAEAVLTEIRTRTVSLLESAMLENIHMRVPFNYVLRALLFNPIVVKDEETEAEYRRISQNWIWEWRVNKTTALTGPNKRQVRESWLPLNHGPIRMEWVSWAEVVHFFATLTDAFRREHAHVLRTLSYDEKKLQALLASLPPLVEPYVYHKIEERYRFYLKKEEKDSHAEEVKSSKSETPQAPKLAIETKQVKGSTPTPKKRARTLGEVKLDPTKRAKVESPKKAAKPRIPKRKKVILVKLASNEKSGPLPVDDKPAWSTLSTVAPTVEKESKMAVLPSGNFESLSLKPISQAVAETTVPVLTASTAVVSPSLADDMDRKLAREHDADDSFLYGSSTSPSISSMETHAYGYERGSSSSPFYSLELSAEESKPTQSLPPLCAFSSSTSLLLSFIFPSQPTPSPSPAPERWQTQFFDREPRIQKALKEWKTTPLFTPCDEPIELPIARLMEMKTIIEEMTRIARPKMNVERFVMKWFNSQHLTVPREGEDRFFRVPTADRILRISDCPDPLEEKLQSLVAAAGDRMVHLRAKLASHPPSGPPHFTYKIIDVNGKLWARIAPSYRPPECPPNLEVVLTSEERFRSLHALYMRRFSERCELDDQRFLHKTWAVCMDNRLVVEPGSHASVPQIVFDKLRKRKVTFECCARPDAVTCEYYCSPNGRDHDFNSCGNLFQTRFFEDKWELVMECNPPFDIYTIVAVVYRLLDIFDDAEARGEKSGRKVSFTAFVFLPARSDGERILRKSTYLRGLLKITEGEHFYMRAPNCENGAIFRGPNTFVSSIPTTLCVLQTDYAHKVNPIGYEVLKEIRAAWTGATRPRKS